MYSRVVVPVDCSELAWSAVAPARQLAEKWGAELELISIVHYGWEIEHATADIERYLAACGWQEGTIVTVLETRVRHVAEVLANHVELNPGSFVMMTSHGRGRSAALFGSVAERVLQLSPDPIMMFGPSIDGDHAGFEGRMFVCVDGTETSEAALEVAAPWAIEFDMEPWVVAVGEEMPVTTSGEMIIETAYPHRMADRMIAATGRAVEYESLHGQDPAEALVDYARRYEGGLIVASTHGRTGFDRLSEGSVTMKIVRDAPCPVLVVRPPEAPG